MHNNFSEIPIFFYCLRCGFAIGLLYDLFRFLRIGRGIILTTVSDTLFGCAAMGMIGWTFYYCDNGNLRLYGLIAIVIGATVYQKLPGRLIRLSIARIKRLIRDKRCRST